MAKQLDMWTSSREGSPAKTLAPRTPAPKGLMVQGADSSSSCSESSVRLDQLGLSLRTHLRCALEAQTGYSMNWKDKGTPAGRSWWVLGMSLHPIDGTEPGLLPTPSGGRRLSKDVEWRGTTAYHLSKKRQVARDGGARTPPNTFGCGIRIEQQRVPERRTARGVRDERQAKLALHAHSHLDRQPQQSIDGQMGRCQSVEGNDEEPWGWWNGGPGAHLSMDDGLSTRVARRWLKAYGNSVVPAIVEALGGAILAQG